MRRSGKAMQVGGTDAMLIGPNQVKAGWRCQK